MQADSQGVMVRIPAHNYTIDKLQILSDLQKVANATVDDDFRIEEILFNNNKNKKWQDVAVFLWVQTPQPGFACMHSKEWQPAFISFSAKPLRATSLS